MTRRFRCGLAFLIVAGWMVLGGCGPKTYLNQIPPPPPSGHGCVDNGGKTNTAAQPAPPAGDAAQKPASPPK